MSDRITEYDKFWLFYLREHSNVTCRVLHYIGSAFAVACLTGLILTGYWGYLLAGFVSAYGCAWIGHFVFEKNRPATFQYPLWSFISDWRMVGCFLTGKLGAELERAAADAAVTTEQDSAVAADLQPTS